MLISGASANVAELFTLPLDTVKVRMQVQGELGAVRTYRNPFHCAQMIASTEGVTKLWTGLAPGLMRQTTMAPLRIGLYQPIRDLFVDKKTNTCTLANKISAGIVSGLIGILVANPFDLVKTRLQAEGKLAPGVPRRYDGIVDAFKKIGSQQGFFGFYQGLGPNILRNCTINAAELASYDHIKTTILVNKWLPDNVVNHIVSAIGAAFIATLCGSPLDVLKTRIMNQKPDAATGVKPYKNAPDAIVKIMKSEGPTAFYKGFIPNFMRIGSWNVVMFLTWEQLRRLY
jgi:solute carrier family 25 uncoupling protein 8/9